jgi:hypothetical protein
LIHRRERGGEVDQRRVDGLLVRLDDLAGEIARLEQQMAQAREGRRQVTEPETTPH